MSLVNPSFNLEEGAKLVIGTGVGNTGFLFIRSKDDETSYMSLDPVLRNGLCYYIDSGSVSNITDVRDVTEEELKDEYSISGPHEVLERDSVHMEFFKPEPLKKAKAEKPKKKQVVLDDGDEPITTQVIKRPRSEEFVLEGEEEFQDNPPKEQKVIEVDT